MIRWLLATVVLALMVAGSFESHARVTVTQEYSYFDVVGHTPRSLMRAIGAHTGDGSLATTGRTMDVLYKIRRDGDKCRLHDVRVTIDITFELPRWQDRSGAREDLSDRFDVMLEALQVHEDGHARLFREEANQLDMMLQTLRRPCTVIDAVARQLPAEVAAIYADRQRDYDRNAEKVEDPSHFTLF